MPRRGALIAMMVLALMSGAIINLAVAWACIWWQRPITRLGQVESIRVSDAGKSVWTEVFGPSVFLDRFDGGRDLDPASVPKSPTYGAMMFWVMENRTESLGMERWWLFDMSRSVAPGVRIVHAGLPMRAFGCRLVTEPRTAPKSRSIFERGGFTVRRGNGIVELPWKPLSPGFILNTTLYALVVAAGLLGWRTMRRKRRRRRGLCVECAYPVGVSMTCSECGAAVEPSG